MKSKYVLWAACAFSIALQLQAQTADSVQSQESSKRMAAAKEAIDGKSLQATRTCPSTSISCPASQTGVLSSASCIRTYSDISLDSYEDLWDIQAVAGQTIVATMTSSAFAPYLTLSSSTSVVAFDNRLADGISVQVVYSVPVSGTYTFRTEALFGITSGLPDTGGYSLSVTGCDGSAAGPPSTTVLNLLANRFQVSATYSSPSSSGQAQAVALTSDTGYFWFFSQNAVEVVVKMVDGRALGGHFWVFTGGLTNVDVTITVRDTLTSQVRTYHNTQGNAFQPVQDTLAF